MNCAFYKTQMYLYIDHELTLVEEAQLKEHLRSCSSCAERMVELKQTEGLINRIKGPTLKEEFTKNLMTKIDNRKYRKGFKFNYKITAMVAAFLIFALVAIMGVDTSTYLVQKEFSGELIREDDTLVVPENTIIKGDLTVVNGNLKILGKVTGDVKAIKGQVILTQTARVGGEIVLTESANKVSSMILIVRSFFSELSNLFAR
jgi:hypothetical protein